MELLVMKDEGVVYRVRKEEQGCSVFAPQHYIEGDDILFEVLKTFNEHGVPQGIQELRTRFQAEPGQIEADLRELATHLIEQCVFPGLSNSILKCLDGEK